MKFKAKLFSFLVSGLALMTASCEKQKPFVETSRVPINIHESIDGSKSILSGTELPETYTIYASAYFTNRTDGKNSMNYFVAKPFSKSDSAWSTDPVVFWPIEGKLDFLFLACEPDSVDIAGCAAWNEGNCSKGVEVSIPDGACLESEILFAGTMNRESKDGSVPIQFKHAQSWIQIAICSDVADILRIDKVVIENAFTGGTLRVSNESFLNAAWEFRRHRSVGQIMPKSEGRVVPKDEYVICNILLPEQDACDISLYYSFKGSPSVGWDTAISSVFHYPASADPWFYGEKNVYKFSFSFPEIMLAPTIETWAYDVKEIEMD